MIDAVYQLSSYKLIETNNLKNIKLKKLSKNINKS